jgi:hypothetical protein
MVSLVSIWEVPRAELIENTRGYLLGGIIKDKREEYGRCADIILDCPEAVDYLLNSVIYVEEFKRMVNSVALRLYSGHKAYSEDSQITQGCGLCLSGALEKERQRLKKEFARCTPEYELDWIINGPISSENAGTLRAECKATMNRQGELIIHPLVLELLQPPSKTVGLRQGHIMPQSTEMANTWEHESNGIERYTLDIQNGRGCIVVEFDGEKVDVVAHGDRESVENHDRVYYRRASFRNGKKTEISNNYLGGDLVYLFARDALKQLPVEIRTHIGPYWGVADDL